jgi:hypothetical protein
MVRSGLLLSWYAHESLDQPLLFGLSHLVVQGDAHRYPTVSALQKIYTLKSATLQITIENLPQGVAESGSHFALSFRILGMSV